jgi:hypothetical protein
MRRMPESPNQRQLDEMLARAHSARVTPGDSSASQALLEIRDPAEVASLAATLRIADGPRGACLCHGDPRIAFFDQRGTPLATISVHHGKRIRWDVWTDDAGLLHGVDLLEWLASRGARGPLDEYDATHRPEIPILARWEAWNGRTPECLRPWLESYRDVAGKAIYVPSPARTVRMRMDGPVVPRYMDADRFAGAMRAIDAAYPDAIGQARVLFTWLGDAGDVWTGFPSYEEVPELLLLRLPFDALTAALEDPYRSGLSLEGAARFFAGWQFGTYRADELTRIPSEVREELRTFGNRSEFPDRLQRVAAAFG